MYLFAGNPNQSTRSSCKKPCSLHMNCANCTSQAMECMWCGSTQRCVDSTAYVISFPYGQCLEWQTTDCVGKCVSLCLIRDELSLEVRSLAQRGQTTSSARLASVSSQYSSRREKRSGEENGLKWKVFDSQGKIKLVSSD